jgi:hypothetical protein
MTEIIIEGKKGGTFQIAVEYSIEKKCSDIRLG